MSRDPRTVDATRSGDLIEVVRVLLLLQGAILLATTIESLVWSLVFAGAPVGSFWLSAAMAIAVFVGRARLDPSRKRARLLYVVEGVLIASLGLDVALATVITGTVPPAVALLTRLVLPIAVVALLERARPRSAAVAPLGAEAVR